MANDELFDPYVPANRKALTVESWNDLGYKESGDVVNVYGRADPVVVTDVRPMPGGSLVLITLDSTERDWLTALLGTGRVIGFTPGDAVFGLPSPCYLYVGKVTQTRIVRIAKAPERRWTLDVQMVTAPVVA